MSPSSCLFPSKIRSQNPSGSVGARQALAVRSWLGLSPDITVVLFSQDPSVVSFAAGFGARVSVESDIDFTFLSTPFFHSMIARSQASKSSISVLIDPETILLPDFISVLNYAHKLDNDWLLIASSRNLSYFPFHLDEDGKHWLDENGKRIRTKKLQGSLAQSWQWKHCEDRMLLAWNNGDLPLHTGVLPPFLFGKGLHNHWIINEALSSRLRFVFDASWSISNFYLSALDNMSYQFRDSSVPNFELRSWEYMGNSHLAALYGSLFFHEENYSNLVKFLKCGRQYVFVNSAESIAYPFGYQRLLSLRKEEVLRSQRRKIVDCVHGIKTLDGTRDCSMKDKLKPSISLSLPFSLEMFLSMLADQNKTIVLAIAGYSCCYMRPPGGVLDPGKSLIATVFKFVEHPENNEKLVDQKSRVKFKIMSLKVEGAMDYVPEQFEEQRAQVVVEKVLQVVFLDPEQPCPALEKLNQQLAEAEAAMEARKKPPEETGPHIVGEGLVIDEWKERRERYLAQQQVEGVDSV